MTNQICDYEDCNEPVCDKDITSITTDMKFCVKHFEEVTKLIDAIDAKGLLRFWIKANGGAQLLASGTSKYAKRTGTSL